LVHVAAEDVILHHQLGRRSAISVGPVLGALVGFAYLVVALVVALWVLTIYAAIAVASVAGGAYLARRRPELGGFRRHTAALWRGFRRRLERRTRGSR
jgi:hypothetical protein